MNTPELLEIGKLIVYVVATAFTIYLSIEKAMKHLDSRINRVYQRMDEEKVKCDNKYPSKEICALRHENIEKILDELKIDIKTLLRLNGKSKDDHQG